MSQSEQTRAFILNYLDALNENATDRIPIAEDCQYKGSMLAETIRGAATVREHIAAIAPFIGQCEILRMVIEGGSGAVIVRLKGLGRRTIEGAIFFEVEDGQLTRMENLYDSRQLLDG